MKNSIEEDIKILERIDVKYFMSAKIEQSDYMIDKADEVNNAIEHILSDYKRVLKENEQLSTEVNSLKKENEELKEYILIAPNLDEMTATKYRNSRQDAYIQGRAEEQQKAEQIIYENYIPIQKVKDKLVEYKKVLLSCNRFSDVDRIKAINERILELQELIEKEN